MLVRFAWKYDNAWHRADCDGSGDVQIFLDKIEKKDNKQDFIGRMANLEAVDPLIWGFR